MKLRSEDFYIWLAHRLPVKIRCFCFIDVMAHSTTGKYGNTIVPELTGMEAVRRFAHDNGMPGHNG